jgi:MFS family permease
MILSGFAIDRFGSKRLMPIFLSPLIVGFWLFATADTVFEGTIAMGCLALASGANSTVPIAYWAETFGTQFIGSIKAMATALMVLGSAIGPGLSGFLIDQGVGFETQLKGFSIFFALACLSVAIGIAVSGRETPRST